MKKGIMAKTPYGKEVLLSNSKSPTRNTSSQVVNSLKDKGYRIKVKSSVRVPAENDWDQFKSKAQDRSEDLLAKRPAEKRYASLRHNNHILEPNSTTELASTKSQKRYIIAANDKKVPKSSIVNMNKDNVKVTELLANNDKANYLSSLNLKSRRDKPELLSM